ncbi:hypothetical protein [Rhodovulum adriaticum]|uniref:Uncharacterized protein n=1 Tax=Rhodovulum adriaticum TaxID=35804 RepID=A0A4R2NYS0_RHOAD|nr:hypothetical protein [Rhodovulum adriaticum]MBK1634972.1 hypothetical protein [Rhodovulum adriaticum]TCP27443.1 hypothetical protein EV656_101349 [Rhodovulum adriaticum]
MTRTPAHIAALAAVLALPGCLDTAPQVGPDGQFYSRKAPPEIVVADGSVAIAAPYGFCVDKSALRQGTDGSFVLLASCAALTGADNAPNPSPDALLTASVAGNPGPGGSAADRAVVLERYFGSEAGRAALARNGRADTVQIDGMDSRDGLFFLHVTDRGPGLGKGLRPDTWRAIFDVQGRIVTASVTGFADRPISDAASRALLRDFATRIRRQTARLPAPGTAPPPRKGPFAALLGG